MDKRKGWESMSDEEKKKHEGGFKIFSWIIGISIVLILIWVFTNTGYYIPAGRTSKTQYIPNFFVK